jgi:flagellar motor component MotA
LEGVISILEGMNPRMIETELLGFFAEANKSPAKAGAKAGSAVAARAEEKTA